jgi:polyisoprenoid-binding protein YceI
MKKTLVVLMSLTLTLTSISCKNEKKVEKNDKQVEKHYSAEPKTTTINWIAYKTTDKVPVKGQFTKVQFENVKKAATPKEALNNLQFKIPVESIFTKDSIRDGKLVKFLFGAMKDTEFVLGKIHMNNENSGTVDITMNGFTQVLPITYVISGQMITLEAVMDLDNWKAQLALASLNEACKVLHTGPDGIAKTWSEVKIEVATYLKYE